ncbi:RBBP9/YdeN family alpha/beta hydrolase [Anaerotignum sp.]|uniref:RBBP9/YdeN family alpha/beta hydrolase n=1 Tax=Anaerotignum sp. TaxID=2039241 RepID=UPI00271458DF|nr:alpha/beta fold hydrolase [Anaerotignum sp.]
MNTTPAYFIHGFTASSKANWFPWLKNELQNNGIQLIVPDMPNTNDPHLLPWLQKIEDVAKELNDNTIFIGHSLGCIAMLQFILKKNIKIKGVILVSGFMDENPMVVQKEGLSQFVEEPLDVEQVKALIPHRVVITAIDDDIVPSVATKKMAERLGAQLIERSNGKHFIDRDGFTQFPEVLDLIKSIYSK